MKNLLKKLYYSKVIAWIIHAIILFIYSVNKKQYINKEAINNILESGKPVIFCCWHGRIFPMVFVSGKNPKIKAVVSRHSDGELISNVLKSFNVKTIRGSSNRAKKNRTHIENRGGAHVVRETIDAISEGYNVAITPDGPRGPRMRFRRNIFKLAQITGAPIMGISFSATNSIIFNSWDRFLLPLPFGKIVVKFTEPRFINSDLNEQQLEIIGKEIEKDLNKITTEVDLICNKTPISPD